MKTNTGLSSKARESVVDALAVLLADEHVLYVKTRNFHWNVTGAHFGALHVLFEKQYDELAETIDEIAERIRSLGCIAPGSMAAFLKLARLSEATGKPPKDVEMIGALLADHESIARALRGSIELADKHGDEGTADFLTGILEAHEKTAWMLRAHLE
ncbi:Dps family protein [Rariglobus hedericola]|uniref:DNA starvation/stationary phase protection protein n=1 Tax=Rariglobus hedericola TaxID=2597822 RepID=A0A556QQ92_9BACT|nr:DNA starvation/stationary phase protection protein [Rariglobus hedericola]TSJ78798.1 DNA starvation/stationary phase protection protein [Rariglobus hedericola]